MLLIDISIRDLHEKPIRNFILIYFTIQLLDYCVVEIRVVNLLVRVKYGRPPLRDCSDMFTEYSDLRSKSPRC